MKKLHELLDLNLPPIDLPDMPKIDVSGFALLEFSDMAFMLDETAPPVLNTDEPSLNSSECIQLIKLMIQTAPDWRPLHSATHAQQDRDKI